MKKYLLLLGLLLPLLSFGQLFYVDGEDTTEYKYYPKRIQELNRLIELDSTHPEWYFKRSILYYKLKNYEQSVSDNLRILDRFGDLESAHGNLGMSYCFLNDSTRALLHVRKAIELEPAKAVNYLNQGFVLLYFDDYLQAIPVLEKALELRKDYAKAYYYLGYAYMKLGNYVQAKMHYQQALNLISYYPEAFYNMGYLCFQEKKYAETISYLTTALELLPQLANREELFQMRGLSYQNTGNKEKGEADLKQADNLRKE